MSFICLKEKKIIGLFENNCVLIKHSVSKRPPFYCTLLNGLCSMGTTIYQNTYIKVKNKKFEIENV
jgi:hypothetical protein